MILNVLGSSLGALSLLGIPSRLGALPLLWPFYAELHISELDEYIDTKPFVNDPLCPWLSDGGSVYVGGSTPAGGSAPPWAHLSRALYLRAG